jgi:UDP-N-acetylglucosamine diphosphorylase/glucosamine-1-phosphate N-acetyltransferase
VRLCVYEDRRVALLDPLTLTRAAFDLWCGTGSLLARQRQAFPADESGVLVRPVLAPLCRLAHPELAVNDPAWLGRPGTVLVNARWLPPPGPVADAGAPRVGLVGDQIAYVILPAEAVPECGPDTVEDWAAAWKGSLPHTAAGGTLLTYPWDLVANNAQALSEDFIGRRLHLGQGQPPEHVAVIGSRDDLAVDPSASVEPFVVADTRGGPVMIDRGAVIHSFTRLEGPCYVGAGSWVLGAKVRAGTTLGPQCRVGGEVEASILHGHSNKYHDGFLGHSYVGEWVNLGAGTCNSDLRNDYGEVVMTVAGERVPTGLTKIGCFLGDHTKSGLGVLLNTGTVVGAFCGLLPSGGLLPRLVPSFCTCGGALQERWELRQQFQTAATVMRRRGVELTDAYLDFYFTLYEQTATFRRQILRESEQRRLRRSLSS